MLMLSFLYKSQNEKRKNVKSWFTQAKKPKKQPLNDLLYVTIKKYEAKKVK